MLSNQDTIAAISTPLGEGGIGIIRISGHKAFQIGEKIFSDGKKQKLSDRTTHTLHHGYITDFQSGEKLDEVMLAVLHAPHTYTTEDMLEINAHGGIWILRRILELILRHGARLAEPGEFTKRAFLNGRIDLTQAEAVADLICSQTNLAEKYAIQQLTGELSKKIEQISHSLLDILSELEIQIDFPEEKLPEQTIDSFHNRIKIILTEIEQLLSSAKFGRAIREGIQTVIIGKPNVGKSSLLNLFLNEPRAIVTPLPGTTRDIITESVALEGIPFIFTDTAGYRDTDDILELEGVKRTKYALTQADILLLLLDSSAFLSRDDEQIYSEAKSIMTGENKNISLIMVLNKSDLPVKLTAIDIEKKWYPYPVISISVLTHQGIDELKQILIQQIPKNTGISATQGLVITNIRHAELLRKTKLSLEHILDELSKGTELECIAADLRDTLYYLGEITGQYITNNLLDRIFARFCIGK